MLLQLTIMALDDFIVSTFIYLNTLVLWMLHGYSFYLFRYVFYS